MKSIPFFMQLLLLSNLWVGWSYAGISTKEPERCASSYAYPISTIESTYQDKELTELWNSLSDINNPNLKDYRKIENYLQHGRRPYLDILFNKAIKNGWITASALDRSHAYHNRILQKFKLAGQNDEMPFQKTVTVGGVSSQDFSRCVIMYSSFNFDGKDHYVTKMYAIIKDLEQSGYKGHVVFRVGGYPMTDKGGLHLVHIPYAFKILSFIEASLRGYQDVLWIDTAVHPTNNLSEVFATIKKNGFYLLHNGSNALYDYTSKILPDDSIKHCGLTIKNLETIPHIIAGIIGISFRNRAQHNLVHEWYRLTTATLPAMSFYPEEFLLSVAAWRTHKMATDHIGNVMNTRSQMPTKPQISNKPFWHDKS